MFVKMCRIRMILMVATVRQDIGMTGVGVVRMTIRMAVSMRINVRRIGVSRIRMCGVGVSDVRVPRVEMTEALMLTCV